MSRRYITPPKTVVYPADRLLGGGAGDVSPSERRAVLEALERHAEAKEADARYLREVVIPEWEESGTISDMEEGRRRAMRTFAYGESDTHRRRVGVWMQALDVATRTLHKIRSRA